MLTSARDQESRPYLAHIPHTPGCGPFGPHGGRRQSFIANELLCISATSQTGPTRRLPSAAERLIREKRTGTKTPGFLVLKFDENGNYAKPKPVLKYQAAR